MGLRSAGPLRGLPRCFVAGIPDPAPEHIDLPKEELDKFRKVLRLSTGAPIAILCGDGRLLECELAGTHATLVKTHRPDTESKRNVTLCLALSRPEKLEESIRMGTELGIKHFVVFPSDRSVVRWDDHKRESRMKRLTSIIQESAEVSYRTHLPTLSFCPSLTELLKTHKEALVLSEGESITQRLTPADELTLVIGPEGGWAPREVTQIAGRERTLGPLVLRVDTASAAACVLALLS